MRISEDSRFKIQDFRLNILFGTLDGIFTCWILLACVGYLDFACFVWMGCCCSLVGYELMDFDCFIWMFCFDKMLHFFLRML